MTDTHGGEAQGEDTMKTTTTSNAYWLTTGIVVLTMFSAAFAELVHRPETINGMKPLDSSVYCVMLIGLWKLLGLLVSAVVSHLACHDTAWQVVVTLGSAALALASWAL
jgi:hypothetical protein